MSTRKEKDIRTIIKSTSGTYGISIPIEIIRELKWRKGQKVRVQMKGSDVVIKDWKPKSK